MNRRSFLQGPLGLLAAPLVADAQPAAKRHRIGLLAGSSPSSPESAHIWAGFFEGLRELGYVEGQNFVIEGRYYGDKIERRPTLAAELVRLQVDVIVAGAAPAPEAAKTATSTIPIVMANHADPVGGGLVASLGRPAGNVTGLSLFGPELRGKQLQLLKEVVPGLVSVAVLSDPTNPFQSLELKMVEAAARFLKLRLHVVQARAPSEFGEAFWLATKERAGAVFVLGGSMFTAHRARLVELAAKSRLPAMYTVKEYAEAGGLMSYGVNIRDSFRRAAGYVDKILKGAKPDDLPVEQPVKFAFAINLKTAKALGLKISPSVLLRADQVIE